MKNILSLLLRNKPKSPKPRPMIVPSPAIHSEIEKTKKRNQILVVLSMFVVLGIALTEIYFTRQTFDQNSQTEQNADAGIQFLRLGNYEEAAQFFRAKLVSQPQSLEDKLNLAYALKQSSNDKEAEKLYLEAIRTNPNEAVVMNNYGVLLSKLGRHDEAELAFEKALGLDSQYLDAALNLGITQESARKYTSAIQTYHQALKFPSLRSGHEKFLQERVRLLQAVAVSQESRGEKL